MDIIMKNETPQLQTVIKGSPAVRPFRQYPATDIACQGYTSSGGLSCGHFIQPASKGGQTRFRQKHQMFPVVFAKPLDPVRRIMANAIQRAKDHIGLWQDRT